MATGSGKSRRSDTAKKEATRGAEPSATATQAAAPVHGRDPQAPHPQAAPPAQATFTISSADLNRNIGAVISHVEETGDRFIVTRYNRPVATIQPNQYLGQVFAHVKLNPGESRREWNDRLKAAGIETGYTSSMAGVTPSYGIGPGAAPAIDALLHDGRELLGAIAAEEAAASVALDTDPAGFHTAKPSQMDATDASHPSRRPVAASSPLTAQQKRDELLGKINRSKR